MTNDSRDPLDECHGSSVYHFILKVRKNLTNECHKDRETRTNEVLISNVYNLTANN